ncbi:MAG TPA: thiamine-phosphate kinase [Desulfotomaculum sp.]|nr:thiamine-phosphate kinase [Desulfotomaculum sp.]
MELPVLGETGLIEFLTRNLNTNHAGVIKGVGDDAAVLKVSNKEWLLLTTDMLVEDVHFSLSYVSPAQIGIKAMVASVSDIAAMGGRPVHAVVSLGVPPRLSVEVLEGVYAGLRQAAGEYGVNIVGGDTVKSPGRLIINVALLGSVEAGQAVYRSGARPGDLIFVTGSLGNSAAGLYLCQNPDINVSLEAAAFLKLAQLEPRARVKVGRLLSKTGKISSMDDISDGLASELHEICRASGAGCRIRTAAVPVDRRMKEAADTIGSDPIDWALYGGEDFELVFTTPPDSAVLIKKDLEEKVEKCYLIGEIVPAAEGVKMELPQGYFVPLEAKGYDHFKGSYPGCRSTGSSWEKR